MMAGLPATARLRIVAFAVRSLACQPSALGPGLPDGHPRPAGGAVPGGEAARPGRPSHTLHCPPRSPLVPRRLVPGGRLTDWVPGGDPLQSPTGNQSVGLVSSASQGTSPGTQGTTQPPPATLLSPLTDCATFRPVPE
jgi:hypothetical protein